MTAPGTSSRIRHDRPLLGLRRRPGRLALTLFRLPLAAYRYNVGPAVGRTFVAFTHTGRRTGRPHQAVAMVLRHDEATGEAVICAAWGGRPAGTATCGPTPRQRCSWAVSGSPHSSGSSSRRRRSTSPSASATRSRTGSRCSAASWLGDLRRDATVREFVRAHPFVAFRPLERAAAAQGGTAPER